MSPCRARELVRLAIAAAALAPLGALASDLAKDARTGCEVAKAQPDWGEFNIVEWDGPCPNGRAEGTGVYQRRNAAGAVAVRYEGGWKDGIYEGRGTVSRNDGRRWEGNFAGGKLNGYVVFTWKDGRYEGEWKDGRYEGRGTLSGNDGRRWEGTFAGGKLNGYAVWTNREGVRFEGQWKDDYRIAGKHRYADGSGTYEGGWSGDKGDTSALALAVAPTATVPQTTWATLTTAFSSRARTKPPVCAT